MYFNSLHVEIIYRNLRIFHVTKILGTLIFIQMDIWYEKLPKYYNSERNLQLARN